MEELPKITATVPTEWGLHTVTFMTKSAWIHANRVGRVYQWRTIYFSNSFFKIQRFNGLYVLLGKKSVINQDCIHEEVNNILKS
jgi:hypothetical protein